MSVIDEDLVHASNRDLAKTETIDWLRQQHVDSGRSVSTLDAIADRWDEALSSISSAARRLATFRGHDGSVLLSRDELHAGAWDWWCRNPSRRRGIARRAPEWDDAEWRRRVDGRFQSDCLAVARQLVEAERTARGGGGLDTDDWWDRGLALRVLPVVWHPEIAEELPALGQSVDGGSSGGGDEMAPLARWQCLCLDVVAAWRRAQLTPPQRLSIELRHRDGASIGVIATELGVSDRQVHTNLRKGENALLEALNGGPSPLLSSVPDVTP